MNQPPKPGPTRAETTEFGATTVSDTSKTRASGSTAPADAPTQSAPKQTGPTQSGPTQSGPTQSGPTQSGPTQSGPTQSGTRQAAPTQTQPAAGHRPAPHPGPGPHPNAAGSPAPAGGPAPRVRGPRRAQLQLRHVNPWTVLRFSCVLSAALFVVWMLVIVILYSVLLASGVVGKINDTVTTINGVGSHPPLTAGVVFLSALIIGVVNIVLFIALSTVGSVIYNLCADLVGGVEVTLSER